MLTKTIIANAFLQAGLPYDKIRKSKLGGFYVYHPFGSEYTYKKYTVVENTSEYIKKSRETIQTRLSFMDNENMLRMAIIEAKNRRG